MLLLLAAVLAAPAAAPKTAPSITFQTTYEAAAAKAKAHGTPIMVDFVADWCGPCHMLDRLTYRDPTVVRLSRRFVSVKVDVEGKEAEQDLARKYLVTSLPTIAFLSPAGRQLWRVNGYASPEEFPSMIEEALKIAARVIAWEAALDKNPKDVAALRGLGFHQFAELQQTARTSEDGLIPKFMLDDAGTLLSRAMALDKDATAAERKKVRRVLGLVRGAEGNIPDTEAMLKAALAVTPADAAEDADTHASLGELYLHQEKKELALKTFRMVAKDYPGTRGATRAAQQLERLLQ
jgi:thiol-disulfide isomerase/thioredoxin